MPKTADRRTFLKSAGLIGAGALGAVVIANFRPAAAAAQGTPAATTPSTPAPSTAAPAAAVKETPPAPLSETFDAAYERLARGRKPVDGKLSIEMPELAENGNMVPFTVSADSPMTDASHVTSIHILSTENPQSVVASFRFTPLSGKAAAASRMRLAKTQEIVCLAELNDGSLWAKRTTVKVTIGGCGG